MHSSTIAVRDMWEVLCSANMPTEIKSIKTGPHDEVWPVHMKMFATSSRDSV